MPKMRTDITVSLLMYFVFLPIALLWTGILLIISIVLLLGGAGVLLRGISDCFTQHPAGALLIIGGVCMVYAGVKLSAYIFDWD